MNNINNYKLPLHSDTTILDCLSQIEKNFKGFVFLIDADEKFVGIVTDGDVRRGLLNGAKPDEYIHKYINKNYVSLTSEFTREQALKIFDRSIKFIPILRENKIINVIFPDDLCYKENNNILSRSKAPVRISFGGGGTDLTSFFSDHGGAVLNSTISLYAHSVLRKRIDTEIHINSYDFSKKISYSSIQDLKYDGELDLIKAAILILKPDFGFDLEIYCDFPPHSGLGGSSAVLTAVIASFNEFREDKLNRYEIAELAFQAERIELSVAGGWQDQYASVFGGFNFIEFNAAKNEIYSIKVPPDIMSELEARLVLCYSGIEHPIGKIHDLQKIQLTKDKVIECAHRARDIAYEMKSSILRGYIDTFGKLLHEAWILKKNFAEGISNSYVDEIYEFALQNGAVGGKILGAGGGGFFLFQAKIDKKAQLISALKNINLMVREFVFEDKGVRSWTVRSDS